MTAPTQPSPEAVGLVAAALRAEGVMSIAVWQGIDYTVEQRNSDAASEALFAYIAGLEADRERLNWLGSDHNAIVRPFFDDGCTDFGCRVDAHDATGWALKIRGAIDDARANGRAA